MKKKIIFLLACTSLLFFVGSTIYTYAKYNSQSNHDIGTYIKKWKIKVNDKEIENNTELSELINVVFENNEHIAENKMAPGSNGSFEIELDYSNVEVSFEYEISIKDVTIADIAITKIEVDNEVIPSTNDYKISNVVNLNDNSNTSKIKKIKVYLSWKDDENATMNNTEDTNIAINNNSIDFDINIRFTQIREP